MTINHLNLTVTDAQGTSRLLETYFGLTSIEGTTDDATFLALRDDKGFTLTVMESKPPVTYPATFHLGFLIHNEERVQAIYEALKNDGYVLEPPRRYRGKSLDLYFATPFGFTIQVS
ncbi:MAG TPA: VOC family protein [Bacteroidia bacterium]|nr:VOC family protein [Bacteroidia bacterium]